MQFLLVGVTTFVGVLALRAAFLVYRSVQAQEAIGKGAIAGMLVESVSLWLGLTVMLAAAYVVMHGV
jgi:hypothetical protein